MLLSHHIKCGFKFDTTYTSLPEILFTKIKPEKVPSPNIIILNNDLAESMGLNFLNLPKKDQAELFSGNILPQGATPFSQAYAGHQFGHFTTLGDGRASVLGEHLTPDDKRLDIQFKGSGRTPYSRRGDGKATLSTMLREYIISEAMHHLGIPTTRSLAVVTTGKLVMREKYFPGAILTRIAKSHLRIGTFEFAASNLNKKEFKALIRYTIKRHYPKISNSKNKLIDLIKIIIEKQISLITNWMRVGFIHGVMNKDNMTLSGETIDYGPCAFMDTYNPNTIFGSIDHMGRYAYMNQPKVAQWNLARFAETLLPMMNVNCKKNIEFLEELTDEMTYIYKKKWLTMMGKKLGLFEIREGDEKLISTLLDWMHKNNADYTNTFIVLSKATKPTLAMYHQKSFEEWYVKWKMRLKSNSQSVKSSLRMMKASNPVVIPRNHKVEDALNEANNGNLKPFRDLLSALKNPYKDNEVLKKYQEYIQSNQHVYQTFCGT